MWPSPSGVAGASTFKVPFSAVRDNLVLAELTEAGLKVTGMKQVHPDGAGSGTLTNPAAQYDAWPVPGDIIQKAGKQTVAAGSVQEAAATILQGEAESLVVPVFAPASQVLDVYGGGSGDAATPGADDEEAQVVVGFLRVQYVEPQDVTIWSPRHATEMKAAKQAAEAARREAQLVAGLGANEFEVDMYKEPLGFTLTDGEEFPTVSVVNMGGIAESKGVGAGDGLLAVNEECTELMSAAGVFRRRLSEYTPYSWSCFACSFACC